MMSLENSVVPPPFSPEYVMVLATLCAANLQVRLWNADTGHCANVFKHDQNNVSSCAWQPDSRHFVVGTVDRSAPDHPS
jgi:WD40 repeat protein